MLNTKDMSAGTGKAKPVIGTGNQKIKINSITFDQTPYDMDAYNITLHVESEPMGGDFNGFLKDVGYTQTSKCGKNNAFCFNLFTLKPWSTAIFL